MLADTPLPRGFGAALASVDTFSKGSRTVRCLPALPCRLRAMGRNHFQQLSRSHSGNAYRALEIPLFPRPQTN